MKGDVEQWAEALLASYKGKVRYTDFFRAWSGIDARVRVATALLNQAISYELSGNTDRAHELWPAVHRRWRALCASSEFRGWLAARAERELGAGHGEQRASDAISWFTRVLLPRSHAAVAVSGELDAHSVYHRVQVDLLALSQGGVDNIDPDSYSSTRVNCVRLMRALDGDPLAPRRIASFIAALDSAVLVRDRIAVADEIAALLAPHAANSERSEVFEQLARRVPEHFGLRRLHAGVVLRAGQSEARRRRYVRAVRSLLCAGEVDPLLLDEVQGGVERCVQEMNAALGRGQSSQDTEADAFTAWETMAPKARHARRRYEASTQQFEEALGFRETVEAEALRIATHVAILTTVVARVGLNPDDPEHREAGHALLAAVGGQDPAARASLIQHHPSLRGAPWDLIERMPGASPAQLAVNLPALPPLPDHTPAELRMRAVHDRLVTETRDLRPARARRLLAMDWSTSDLDLVPKLAAAAGIVMLVIGLVVYAVHGRRAARRDADYARLQDGITANDRMKTIGAARDFIAATPDIKCDYRSQRVADEYAKDLLVQMREAATAKDTASLTKLAKDARSLRVWYTSNAAVLGKEEQR